MEKKYYSAKKILLNWEWFARKVVLVTNLTRIVRMFRNK